MEATPNNVTTKKVKEGKFEKRVHEIDCFRGFLIIIVFIDHLLNNLSIHGKVWFDVTGNEVFRSLFNAMDFYWNSDARLIVRCVILGLFCLVSGISCAFSKNNWKRAAETLLLGAVIAVGSNILQATGVFGQNMRVDHNIIMVLGWSTLIYCFFQNKSNKWVTYGMVGLFFFSIVGVPLLYQIPGAKDAYVPAMWEPTGAFQQADWMPLFPYIGLFFMGALLGRIFYKEKQPLVKRHEWERPICFLGRHTLLIYLSHYLVLMGIFNLIDVIVKAAYGKL